MGSVNVDLPPEVRFRVEGRPCAYVRMTRGTKWGARAQRYLAYRAELGYRAKEAGASPCTGPVRIHIQAYVKRRTFDLDNLVKAVLDGLNGVAFVDDKQVYIIQAAIAITPSDEALYVTVNAAKGE
jgi:crossover junction endodeoxyribonuclease RusA